MDFNAAKAEAADETRDTILLGTAGFAAPEQYGFSSSSPRTDIYAVGVLLNVMLTGALPWEKAAGGRLKRVIRRCLQLNPRDRYLDVPELYRALNRAGQTRARWLPPGFHTLRLYKILVAVPAYLGLIFLSVEFARIRSGSAGEQAIMGLAFFLLGLLLILFYSNYMGIRRRFPFMRSPHKALRLLGLALAPFLLYWAMILFIVLLQSIFL